MRVKRFEGENGSALMIILMCLVFILALAAGVSQVTLFSLRATDSSDISRRAFYLTDSGIQIGNARLRASNGTLADTTFTENIAGGTVTVAIAKVAASRYRVTSTGTIEGQTKTAEMEMEFTSSFSLQGAIEFNIQKGVEVDGNLPVDLQSTSKISGKDHDSAGVPLADQSKASYGLALNPIPGGKGLTITKAVGATLEGIPATSTNTAADQSSVLKALRNYAKTNADVVINGSKTLGNTATGSYGTAAAQKLVYANVGEEGNLTMTEGFTGYGTLVIDIGEAEDGPTLVMNMTAKWHGLILIYFRDEAEVEGGSLVKLSDSASLLGGLAMFFNTEEIEVEGSGKLVQTLNSSSLLYSSNLVSTSKGVSSVASTGVKIISYILQ